MVFVLTGVAVQGATVWYVSEKGRDTLGCGNKETTSCRTIKHVMAFANDTDHIQMMSSASLCNQDKPIIIETSLSFSAMYNDRPSCTLLDGKPRRMYVHGTKDAHVHVNFTDITFENMEIVINSVFLNMYNNKLINSRLRSDRGCSSVHLHIENTVFSRGKPCYSIEKCIPRSHPDQIIACRNLSVNIISSVFQDLQMRIGHNMVTRSAHVHVENCTFTKVLLAETGQGGLHVVLPWSQSGWLYVANCSFENMRHYDPIFSAINIEAAALRIESDRLRRKNHTDVSPVIYPEVLIESTNFLRNERALSISMPYKRVSIKYCRFEGNAAVHAASAIRLAASYSTPVYISDTDFISNAAGHTTHRNIKGRFQFNGEQVWINGEKFKGAISLVGKGGAVRIQKGRVNFNKCKFYNNTAKLLGGSIYVDSKNRVHIENSDFENTDRNIHSLEGDILYSTGFVMILDSKFEIRTAKDHVTMLRHSGDYWSMYIHSLLFRCAVGQRLLIINTTSHKITPDIGLLSSHSLDQLSYYCQTCPDKEYSLDFGYLNYTQKNNLTTYYTLYINGEEPFQSHSVEFAYGNITCVKCPYGGECLHKITAVPNFWGYNIGDHIMFQHCPSDYCCSSPKCPSYNACALHRVGYLCGECAKGYTEALFSPKCLTNDQCDAFSWVWLLTATLGFLYCLFLIFQQDIMRNIFSFRLVTSKDASDSDRGLKTESHVNQGCGFISSMGVDRQTQRESSQFIILDDINEDDSKGFLVNSVKRTAQGNEVKAECKQRTDEQKKNTGFLIILFYYFQDALLFHVNTVYTRTYSKPEKQIKAFLLGFFRLRLDIFQFMDDVCIYVGLDAVGKALFKNIFVPYVFCLFGLFYACNICTNTGPRDQSKRSFFGRSMSVKLSEGFLLAILFTYQKIATTTFTLLNCVPVGDTSVLYIQGTQECFQGWQYGVMLYAVTCMLPFGFVLLLGPTLLQERYMSLKLFFLACFLPGPVLLVWFYKLATKSKDNSSPLSDECTAILKLLQGPFKEPTSDSFVARLCWSGVLMIRRMVLFLFYTFINDVLIRTVCMLMLCFIILLHHMYVQPYKLRGGNIAGTISAAALLVVGGINFLRASFETAEYLPHGPNKILMEVFEEIENTLILWLPLAGMCIIGVVVVAKLLLIVVNAVLLCRMKTWFSRPGPVPQ